MLYRTLQSCDAHYPRQSPSSSKVDEPLKIAYNVFQSDRPSTLQNGPNFVFCHASTLSKAEWTYIIEQLYKTLGEENVGKAVALDCVSHSDSYLLNEGKIGAHPHLWQDYARDIIKVTVSANFGPGPIILIGHSMGATAAAYASVYSTMYSALICFEPVVGPAPVDEVMTKASGEFTPVILQGMGSFVSMVAERTTPQVWNTREEATKYLSKRLPSTNPRVFDDLMDDMLFHRDGRWYHKTPRPQQLSAYLSVVETWQYAYDVFHAIRIPTLNICAELEDFNQKGTGKRIAREIFTPLAKSIVLPGTRHLMCTNKPDTCLEAIIPFIRQVIRDYRPFGPAQNVLKGDAAIEVDDEIVSKILKSMTEKGVIPKL